MSHPVYPGGQPSTWAQHLLDAGNPDVPEYGSPAWHALPADSPARVAACVRAAEAWRVYTDPEETARRLAAEVAELRYQQECYEAQVAEEEWQAVRDRLARPAPSQRVLRVRRGDFTGAVRALEQEERVAHLPFSEGLPYPAVAGEGEGPLPALPSTASMIRRVS